MKKKTKHFEISSIKLFSKLSLQKQFEIKMVFNLCFWKVSFLCARESLSVESFLMESFLFFFSFSSVVVDVYRSPEARVARVGRV